MALEFGDACGSVALPFHFVPPRLFLVVFLCAMQCGRLLEGLPRVSLSPEARIFTAVQAALGVHAIASVHSSGGVSVFLRGGSA